MVLQHVDYRIRFDSMQCYLVLYRISFFDSFFLNTYLLVVYHLPSTELCVIRRNLVGIFSTLSRWDLDKCRYFTCAIEAFLLGMPILHFSS